MSRRRSLRLPTLTLEGAVLATEEPEMYAISHAASALVLKRRFPSVPLWPLLVSVQLVELLWCTLVWEGVERVSFYQHHVSLDFLPYSHSVGSGLLLAIVALALLWRAPPRMQLAVAFALGVASHVLLDVVQHQPDIQLLPVPGGPRLGLRLMDVPLLNLAVEIGFGVFCWRVYGGRRRMLAGIVLFNLANLPAMLQLPAVVAPIEARPALLPALILAQIVVTWVFVAWWARSPSLTQVAVEAAARHGARDAADAG